MKDETNASLSLSKFALDGLWRNNPGLVQLLGLCPLAAVSTTAISGLSLGIATLFTLLISNILISSLRGIIPSQVRIPAYVLLIAAAVSAVDLLMNAYYHELHERLGLFIPLIVTNCVILARAEALASKSSVRQATADALAMGAGFAAVLGALGAIREIAAQGSLLAQADLLFGEWGAGLRFELFHVNSEFLLAALPPGAFFGLALLVALHNKIISARQETLALTLQTTKTEARNSL